MKAKIIALAFLLLLAGTAGAAEMQILVSNTLEGNLKLSGFQSEAGVLEANADYWLGAPAIQTLVFETESGLDQRLARLSRGDVDLIADLLAQGLAPDSRGLPGMPNRAPRSPR